MKSFTLPLILLLTATVSFSVTTNAYQQAQPAVKKSTSGICHDESSVWYSRTKRYEAFASIEECINNGGRLPKAASQRYSEDDLGKQYDRDLFGGWLDTDNNCIDKRGDILIARSQVTVTMSRSGCYVVKGKWFDQYTGRTYTQASDVDIDHVVPLYLSFNHGSDEWDQELRYAFANDPENLMIVDDSTNQAKSASSSTDWLPPNQNYHCDYAKHFYYIAMKYPFDNKLRSDAARVVEQEC